MPNNCENTLTVTGPAEDLRAFKEFAKGDGETEIIHISHFLPIPQEVMDDSEPKGPFKVPSWYAWALRNWGTKWDVYHSELEAEQPNTLAYRYTTGYAPLNERAMQAMSGKFPRLTLRADYDEPMNALEGSIIVTGAEYQVP